MTINIDKLQEPYDFVDTTIGKLCMFRLTGGDMVSLEKELNKSVAECEPYEFVRTLAIFMCYPVEELKEGSSKPENYVLTKDKVQLLTNDDIEEIATSKVKTDEYLSEELQKEEGETNTKYLHRLFVNKKRVACEFMGKFASSLAGFANFSDKLGTRIGHLSALGNTLRKTSGLGRPLNIAATAPNTNFRDMIKSREELRQKPFHDLSKKLDLLIDCSDKSIEFMVEANEIQTRIAGEIKASGDATTTFSKKNIRLSFVVIILMLVSIGIPFCTTSNDRNQLMNIQTNVDSLSGNMSEMNNNSNKKIEELLQLLRDSSNKENEQLKKLVDKQTQIIEELKNIRGAKRVKD